MIVCLAVLAIWWCLCCLVCLDDLGLVSGLTIAGFWGVVWVLMVAWGFRRCGLVFWDLHCGHVDCFGSWVLIGWF